MPGRTKWMKTLGELCSRSSLKLLFYNCGTISRRKGCKFRVQWFGNGLVVRLRLLNDLKNYDRK